MAEKKQRIHPVDRHVGQRIRWRRATLKVSQEELGNRLNVSFQQVQKYERALNRVSVSMLYEISQALETTPAWFYQSYETLSHVQMVYPTLAERGQVTDQEIARLVKYFSRIRQSRDRERIIAMIHAYAREEER